MRYPIPLLAAAAAAQAAFAGHLFEAHPGERVAPHEILVEFRPGANHAAVLSRHIPGAQSAAVHGLETHHVSTPATAATEALMRRIARDPDVVYVEPNRIRTTTVGAPNDPQFASQWPLAKVRALDAWRLLPDRYLTAATAGTGRIKVAVLDTGADCTHADFRNSGGTSVYSSAGGQFSATLSQALVSTTIAAPACTWQDDHGHGTHVAGTIAAATQNGAGVSALGYPVELLVFKVLNSAGSGTDATIASAITRAADAGARIISLSLGGAGYSQTLQNAVNYAWQRDALVVAATGNSNTSALHFPAGAHHALGVAATDSANNRASFSNYGPSADIAAPGVSVLSTYPGGYAYMSGTSMATPHVSALAGLVALATPGVASTGIAQRLQRSANSTKAGGGWDTYLGYGVIDAWRAVSGNLRAATSGAITGQAVNSSGLPLSATVTISGQSVATGTSGLFRISGLAPGNHLLTASAAGYPSVSATVSVVPGADSPITVRLSGGAGMFTGLVSAAGASVEGAVVQALQNGLVASEAIVNTAGQFFLSVPAGTYDLRATHASFGPAAAAARVVASGGTTNVSLTMPRLGYVTGTVKNSSGAAVAGAGVRIFSGSTSAGAATDAAGAYSTIGVPPGNYTVEIAAAGYPTFSSTANVLNDVATRLDATLGGITVTVTPDSVNLSESKTAQFAATVVGSANQAVAWTRSPAVGTISASGLYTSPATISSPQTITITATSVADPARSATAQVQLASAPTLTLTVSPASVVGGAAATANRVTLSAPAPAGGAVVTLSSSNPALATPPVSVTVPAGAVQSAAFSITTTAVAANTVVAITAAYSGIGQSANLTVIPAALSAVTLSPAAVVGGLSTTANTLTLTGPAPMGGAVVSLSSSVASARPPASVTIAAGQTSATFPIETSAVTASTAATITASYKGVARTATLIVQPSVALLSLALSPATVTGGVKTTANQVILSAPAPAGGIVVTLQSANAALAAAPLSVTVPAGSTSATFAIATASVASQTLVNITASSGGVAKTAPLTLQPPAPAVLKVSSAVTGGLSTTQNYVMLNAPAPVGGAVVALASSSPVVVVPASTRVDAGHFYSPMWTLMTKPVTAPTTVTISATYGGVTRTATVVVNP